MRTITHLNFGWKYSERFSPEMTRPGYDDGAFATVDIPHANKEIPFNYFNEKIYQFVCCYRKRVEIPAENLENGRRQLLHFEGAANWAKVYVNGTFAGGHKGGYTPFALDITELVCPGENLIAVELDCTERPEIPPFGYMVDYLCYGGIYREVWLETVEETYIEDLFVKTPDALAEKKTVEADVTFNKPVKGEVLLRLTDGETVLGEKTAEIDGKVLRVRWRVENVRLWDVDDPKLYTLSVSYRGDGIERRFGFREARFEKRGFYLNGRLLQLVGLNRHQSYPYVGNAMPRSAQEADADLLKYTLGCNFVRTAHYPDSVHFLNRCDEIGLIVFTEMPSWQHLGEGEWRENCIDNIRRMIVRDRSHPSVVLWGVRVNEGGDCDEFYTETNALAHALDPTRQTGGVRNMPRTHLLEDVYTYNDFSHSGGKIRLLPPAIVTGFKAPYLVTENNGHMYPTKSFDKEEVRREHALRHLRVQDAAFGSKRISGATGWCMADYNTHKDFGSGDRICYHGVTDMFRVPKLAAYVYASQQDNFPVMESSSAMDVGEYPGAIIGQTYIFTNCDYVEVYKNGEYKSTAYPDKKAYPHLPHPPISPYDFIGDALEKDEGLDKKTADAMKNALCAANTYGFAMPPKHYAEVVYAFFHGKMKFQQIYDIVTKYFANWGVEQVTYRYDGYKDGKLVKSITRTAVSEMRLNVKPDKDTLSPAETYDVTRVELTALDDNGNRLAFANNAVKVEIEGPAKIIGPDCFALIGGDRAFWVRTTGGKGDVKITVTAENLGAQTIGIKVV
ncbi:MAG: glycoside hydrolase family 2 protein [Clostridia bacterium]|nr:glycoside hydrolase family 2 protein [Clostridia bacterium]